MVLPFYEYFVKLRMNTFTTFYALMGFFWTDFHLPCIKISLFLFRKIIWSDLKPKMAPRAHPSIDFSLGFSHQGRWKNILWVHSKCFFTQQDICGIGTLGNFQEKWKLDGKRTAPLAKCVLRSQTLRGLYEAILAQPAGTIGLYCCRPASTGRSVPSRNVHKGLLPSYNTVVASQKQNH